MYCVVVVNYLEPIEAGENCTRRIVLTLTVLTDIVRVTKLRKIR
jgi:hypothetical protein